ncbi:ABC transporter permease subunit [Amycolatopsis cihanbeyliensis]|uniref:ABC-2 type transport system permease protein n=1 Tax=Amycolatopsis cihanbeyliensis TaxID=1128664 RepID=A0A542DBL4_AMYCI|nr:ABC transporter permease subunit [Amycolatopsis cihanbeyliensis]TQJ00456.1 ABC-2 type transport system permease protein [Amycolatopsis cihanbeyliensis]
MNLTIAGLTARALFGRRRLLLLLPMPLLLIGLTVLAAGTSADPAQWGPIVLGDLGLGVILPLTALIIGSSVLGLEIEDGTITHVLSKPVPRSEIVVTKLAVAWGATAAVTAVPLAIAGAIAGSPRLAVGLGLGTAVGALVYTALFLALSLLSRRPVAVGLVYIMLWENLLTRFVGGARVLSVQEYSTTLAGGLAQTELLTGRLLPITAALLAIVLTALGAAVATARLRSFTLAGETG